MNKFIWLLKREIWESRGIWMAPTICAAIMILGTLLGVMKTGSVQIDAEMLDKIHASMMPGQARGLIVVALITLGVPFLITAQFTQYFYTLDALFSERRDRSILFWRSLPVSDRATVLSKVVVAALLIPLAAAVATLVTSIVLFAIASVKAPAVLPLAAYLWSPSVWVGWVGTLLYLTLASALWFLPVIGLNLLVSAWAPRSPLGYAAMVPAAIMLAERVVFGTNVFWRAVVAFYAGFPQHALVRSGGSLTINFENPGSLDASVTAFDFIHPLGFLATPALWVYVALGAAMIAGAIGLRRYRDSVA